MPEQRTDDQICEQVLRSDFNRTLAERLERSSRARIHHIIPDVFFSAASTECKDMYVAGTFYGCVALCQSVAEGLSKFVAEKASVRAGKGYADRIERLTKSGIISSEAGDAFRAVHGDDRNDFHHLNSEIEQDRDRLEARALECLNALYAIESEIFGFEVMEGGQIKPLEARYWPSVEDSLNVYLRFRQ